MNPLVSIIIPTFNRAGFLSRCINSCLSQTCKDIEIIVVDDASTDTTSDYILSLRDKRLKYIKHAANRGPAAARNTGLKTAKGEYIAFLDSDDEWYPEKIEKQLAVFKNAQTQIGLVFTNGYRDADKRTFIDGKKFSSIVYDPAKDNFFPLNVHIPTPSSWMLTAEVAWSIGMFDERMRNWEDGDYLARIAYRYPLYFLNEELVVWHTSPEHADIIGSKLIHGKELFLKNNLAQMKKDRRYLFKFYKTLSKDAMKISKTKSLKYLFKALQIEPCNLPAIGRVFRIICS